MILYRVGPGKWLTIQLFLFGLVSTFQAWQTSYSGFLATRFLLGVTESGYIPGGLWTLSTWYTKQETAKRVMVFFFGNMFGQASAKLIAYGILHMRGVAGYPGWFWLFIIMGGFTILSGILLGFCLPDSFANPRSWFLPKFCFFTERELYILQTRVQIDDPNKSKKRHHIGIDSFKRAVSLSHRGSHLNSIIENGLSAILILNFFSSPTGFFGSMLPSPWETTARSVASTPMDRLLFEASVSNPFRAMLLLPWACSSRSPSPLLSVGFRTNSMFSLVSHI